MGSLTEVSLSAGSGGAAGVLGPREEQLVHGPEPGEWSLWEGSRALTLWLPLSTLST